LPRGVGVLAAIALSLFAVVPRALAAPGDLDESLAQDGSVMLSAPAEASAIAVQTDGATVIVGSTSPVGPGDTVVARYLPDGSPDLAFATLGAVTLDVPTSDPSSFSISSASDVVISADGEILIAGQVGDSGSEDTYVTRLRADGSLDTSFGMDGFTVLDLGRPVGLALDSSRRIVLASQGGVARLLEDGSADGSFADQGVQEALPMVPQAVAVAPADRVVIGGGNGNSLSTSGSVRVSTLDPGGKLDPAFGDGGTVEMTLELFQQGVDSLAVDAAGRIVLATYDCKPTTTGPQGGLGYCTSPVFRLSAGGQLDQSFGDHGREDDVIGDSIRLDDHDRIVSLGGLPSSLGRNYPTAVELSRTDIDGRPDVTFGVAGTARGYSGVRSTIGRAVALGPDGRLSVLAGSLEPPTLFRFDVADGNRDSDADQLGDQVDVCPLFNSHTARGCPRVRRAATLMRVPHTGGRTLQINLSAKLLACAAKERLLLRRQGPGKPTIRVVTTDRDGERLLHGHFPSGSYRLSSAGHLEPKFGFCERLRTNPKQLRTPGGA